MKEQTRYQYEKRIRELSREVTDLRRYKSAAIEIFDGVCEMEDKDTFVSRVWLLKRFRQCLLRIYP